MPLEVGSVFVRIAGLFVKDEFDKADARVDAMRAKAKDPIMFKIGVDATGIGVEAEATHAEVKAETDKKVDIPVGVNGDRAVVEAAAIREAVQRELSTGAVSSGGNGLQLSLNPGDRKLLEGFASGGSRHRLGASRDIRQSAHDADSGGLSLGHLIEGLLHKPGGPMGLGGMSLGSMIGLGPEHLITAAGSFLGTLGPAAAGAGLVGAGWAGREAIGGGADALVSHQTRANVEAMYKDVNTLNQAIGTYGKKSTEAKNAQKAFNYEMTRFGKGPGTTAEEKVAKQVSTLVTDFKKGSQEAQAESAGFMSQVVKLAQDYLPMVLQAAQKNLGIVDKDLKPLFSWLEGPEGKGIFNDLENDFSKRLPGSMKMVTNAIELVLKLVRDAANETAGKEGFLEKFFGKENHKSAADLEALVHKLIGDFDDWMKLLGAFGKVFSGILHDSAHEGIGLVKQLTEVLDKMAKWERSATGSKELHAFFEDRAHELEAILHTLGPLLKLFFQFYDSVQVLVPGVTDLFKILDKILTPIAKLAQHNKVFNDAFVVPLGAFILLWNRFGWEKAVGVVRKLGSAFSFLGRHITGASKAQKDLTGEEEATKGGSLLDKAKRAIGVGAKDELGGGGIGGATGMGRPGTKSNPIVVTEIDPKYSGMGNRAKGYEKEMEEGEGLDKGAKDAKRESDVSNLLNSMRGGGETGEVEEAAGGAGVLSKLKGLVSGGLSKAKGLLGGGGEAEVGAEAGAEAGGLSSLGALAGPLGVAAAAVVAIAKATGTMGNLTKQVLGPFKNAWKEISGDVTHGGGAFKTLRDDIKDAVSWLEKLVKSPGFKEWAMFMEDMLGAVAKLVANVLVTSFKVAVSIITDCIRSIEDAVKSLVDIFEGIFDIIKGIVTGNFSEVKAGFAKIGEGILEGIKSVIVGLPKMVWDVFKDMVEGVLSYLGINSPSTLFAQIGHNIVQGIMGVLESLPNMFLHLGENMVKSMVSGIGNLAGAVGGAVKHAASSAWHGITHGASSLAHSIFGARGMQLPGYAGGGVVPGSEYGLTDKMTLVDPSGRPRAHMAGDESVYTRHQRPIVDAGLRMMGYGGSEDLWNRVNTPHSHVGGLRRYGGGPLSYATGGPLNLSGLTTSAILSRYGPSALRQVDTKFNELNSRYNSESNIYSIFSQAAQNASGSDSYDSFGTYTPQQLRSLMSLLEQQWDVIYPEYMNLPNALKQLQGVSLSKTTTGGSGNYYSQMAGYYTQKAKNAKSASERQYYRIQASRYAQEAQGGSGSSTQYSAASQQVRNAISAIRNRIGGGVSSPYAQDLTTAVQNMIQLEQSGATIPSEYQHEITQAFKQMGITLPSGWATSGQQAQESQSWDAFSAFQSSLTSTFGSFGSNFVNAGANPFGGRTGKMAGLDFYGATAGQLGGQRGSGRRSTLHLPSGGGLPEMQAGGDTNINITQHFGGPAPHPHSYSTGLKYELTNALIG